MKKSLIQFLAIIPIGMLYSCASIGSKENSSSDKFTQFFEGQSASVVESLPCPKTVSPDRKENWFHWLKVANGCSKESRWKDVEVVGQFLAESEPKSPWGVYYLGLVALERNDYQRSLWMIENAIKRAPRTGIFYYQKARVLWGMKEYPLATTVMEESLRLDSQNIEAHQFMGQILLRDLDFQHAAEHLSLVVEKKRRDPVILDQLSYCYYKLQKSEQSLEWLKLAIDVAPKRFDLRWRQAQIYENQLKNSEEALNSYRTIKSMLKKGQLSTQPTVNLDEKITKLEGMISSRKPAGDEKLSLNKDEETKAGVKK